MFTENFSLKGIHAEIVTELTNSITENKDFKIFKYNKDVIKIAPIIGLLYKKRASKETKGEEKKINVEQMIDINKDMLFNFYTVMLFHDSVKSSINERLDKAFKEQHDPVKSKKNLEIFYEYLYGGLIVLKEKLLDKRGLNTNDKILEITNFIEDFNLRFYTVFSEEDLLKISSSFVR
jgi:hypothetical protein